MKKKQINWTELKEILVDRFSLSTVQRTLSYWGLHSINSIESPAFIEKYNDLPSGNQILLAKEIAGIYWKSLDFFLKQKHNQYDKQNSI